MPNIFLDDLDTYVMLSVANGRDARSAARTWITVNGTDDSELD